MTEHTQICEHSVFAALTRKRGHMITDNCANPQQPKSSREKGSSDGNSQSSSLKMTQPNDTNVFRHLRSAGRNAAYVCTQHHRETELWRRADGGGSIQKEACVNLQPPLIHYSNRAENEQLRRNSSEGGGG